MGHRESADASRQRLAAIVSRLRPADLRRTNTHGWTVSALLAHIAFWDRFTIARWERFDRDGSMPPTDVDLVNAAAVSQWKALPAEVAAREALEAAEAVDAKISALPDDVVLRMLAEHRAHLVDRSAHRKMHLDEIERAIAG
jgi:hypothetical protein